TADTILLHGKVYTGDPAHFAQAIAIGGKRIIAVGTDAEISALADHATDKFDLNGAVVIPGLNDAHLQIAIAPERQKIATTESATFDEVKAALEWITSESAGDTWVGGIIGPEVLRDPRMTSAWLDKITQHRRVMLETKSGHAGVWSDSALASIHAGSVSDPAGGWFGHDAQGKPDGKAYEYAHFMLKQRLADVAEDDQIQTAIHDAAAEALVHGVTTLQNVALLPYARFHRDANRAGVKNRLRELELVLPGAPSAAEHPTAYVIDGTPLDHTAAVSGIYPGTKDENGKVNFISDQIAAFLSATKQANQQPLLDVAGDRAIRVVLDAVDAAAVPPAMRVRLDRADGLTGDLLGRAAKAGVVVVATPSRFDLRPLYPQQQTVFALKTILANKIPLAFGSEGGASNPFVAIMNAVNNGSESITVAQAVDAFTAGGAYAELTEKDKGTLAPGKLADLAVLTQDIFHVASSSLSQTAAAMTMIDGKIVSGALVPLK
ncbi:MAG TPA: amidohydrolase family protein, partial [Thermoanaerobaculia bacterium]|nr:amidohydrolase family protein [Thermoanaerobaculia bacterium]